MRLNEQSIRKLEAPAPPKQYILYRDAEIRGFAMRVMASGQKSFTLDYSVAGRGRRLTIGEWPAWTTTAARARAKELRQQIDRGEDPLAEKQTRRAELTFRDVGVLYLDRHASKKKSGDRDRDYLERDAFPVLGAFKIGDIRRSDIIALIEAKSATAPVAANRLLSCLSKLFNFAIARDIGISVNPCARLPKNKEKPRSRALSEDEIRTLWDKLTNDRALMMGDEIRRALRVCLATSQRPGEIVSAEWSEINIETGWWSIPDSKTKNGRPHRVYLSALALEQLPERGESRWMFPSRKGNSHIGEGAVGHAVYLNRVQIGIPAWTPHDLRRTGTTIMASAKVPRHVLKKVLNHAEPGVTATVYDQYEYAAEKQNALRKLEQVLRRIIGEPAQPAKVVPMVG